MATKIRLIVPLPRSFGDGGTAADRLELTLDAAFQCDDVATVVDPRNAEVPRTRQTYCTLAAGQLVAVEAKFFAGTVEAAASATWTPTDRLFFDVGLIAPTADPEPKILLRGSLAIPAASLIAADTEFADRLASLWPTHSTVDIGELRIEPAGLYLLGRMPDGFFPLPTDGDGAARRVVLRVPQVDSDLLAAPSQVSPTPAWTLPAFKFAPATGILDSRAFLAAWIAAFAKFENQDGATFLDNLVSQPDDDCRAVIHADGENIAWRVERLSTRVTLGVGARLESSYFPETLEGGLKRNDGSFTSAKPIAFVSGRRVDPGNPNKPQAVHLSQKIGGQPTLEFDPLQCSGESVPSTLLSGADGRLVLDVERPIVDRPAEKRRLPIRRSWICSAAGWMCLDSLHPSARLKPADEIPASEALQNPIALSQWLNDLDTSGAPTSDMRIELEAIGRVRDDEPESTRIELALSTEEQILTLSLFDAKVRLRTPPVWFFARRDTSTDDRTDQPVPLLQTPNLTADSFEDPDFDAARRIQGTLRFATFASANVLADDDEPLAPVADGAADRLNVEVAWTGSDFTFAFQRAPLTIWAAPPDLPIVQSTPLSPTSPRDMFLDANRGLIPYKPVNQGNETIEIGFPAGELPDLPSNLTLPAAPLPGAPPDEDWRVPAEFVGVRYFSPSLPGIEMRAEKNDGAVDLRWSYRHANPALDEAYTEVAESVRSDVPPENNPPPKVPVEHTRVAGQRAFEIDAVDSETTASGWLLPSGGGTAGDTKIKLKTVRLEGRAPQVEFELVDAANHRIAFDRPVVGKSTVAELTLGISAAQVSADPLPTFNVTWNKDLDLSDVVNAKWPRPLCILNNGQPLVAQRLSDGRVVTLDGAGTVRAEAADPATVVERRGPLLRETITAGWKFGDSMTLDVAGIVLDENDAEAPILGDWTFHDGRGGYPVWRSIPLLPVRLVRITRDGDGGDNFQIVLEAAPLWRKPAWLNAADVADDRAGTWTLTFSAGGTTPALQSVDGLLDWRFPQPPLSDASNQTTPPPHLVRLLGRVVNTDVASLTDGTPFRLELTEASFEHVDLGLIRLIEHGESKLEIGPGGDVEYRVAKTGPLLSYDIDHSFKLGEGPPSLNRFDFKWSRNQDSGAAPWQLQYVVKETKPNWFLHLRNAEADLLPPVALQPGRVGPRKLLFQVEPTPPLDPEQLRTISRPDAWFAPQQTIGGVVAVEFAPASVANYDLKVQSIAAEVQILLIDAPFRTHDAVHVYVRKPNELTTVDRDTGDIFEPVALTDIGIAGDSDQLIWGTRNLKTRRWQRSRNLVDSRFLDGFTLRDVKMPELNGEPVTMQSAGVLSDSRIVVLDPLGNLVFTNLADPAEQIITQNGSPKSLIEGAQGDFSDVQTLVTSRRYKPGFPSAVAVWSRTKADGSGSFVRVWDRQTDPSADLLVADNLHPKPIESVDILPSGHILSGDVDGRVVIWKKGFAQNETKTFLHGEEKIVSAVAALGDVTFDPKLFLSADTKGLIRLWNVDDGSESIDVRVLDHGIKGLAALDVEIKEGKRIYYVAILSDDGSVSVIGIQSLPSEGLKGRFIGEPELLDLRGTFAESIAALPTGELQIAGRPNRTRLSTLLRVEREQETDVISLEATGWISLENDVRFTDKVVDDSGTELTVQCTHKIRLHVDRAVLPVAAILQGLGSSDRDAFVAGVVEHTFRFGRDPEVRDVPLQVERVWQVPQIVRLSTVDRVRRRLNPAAPVPSDGQKNLLAVDASSASWLAWGDPAGSARLRRQSSSEVATHGLRLRLRARKSGRFQASDGLGDAARLVRIPFVAAPGWVTQLPKPDGDHGPSAAFHQITLDQTAIDDAKELFEPTSGVQPAPLLLPDLPDERKIEYVRRASQARLDPDAVKGGPGTVRPVEVRDALWLDAQFLARTLLPAAVGAGDPAAGGAVPVWSNSAIDLPKVVSDLKWLRAWPPRLSSLAIPPATRPATPGSVKVRRARPPLLAAAVAHKHDPADGPQTLPGDAILEFPFDVEAEPQTSLEFDPDSAEAENQDVQLVVFERGRLVRIASDRILIEGFAEKRSELPDNAAKSDALKAFIRDAAAGWGRRLMQARRRGDPAFVLLDARTIVPIPPATEANRATLTTARPWTDDPVADDERRRLPTAGKPGEKLLIAGDSAHALLLFDADPEPRVDSYPGVAATRFRLALRQAAGKPGVLHPAHTAVATADADGEILLCNSRDEVPFQVVTGDPAAGVAAAGYPRVDPGSLAARRLPVLTPLLPQATTLWPPVWDCVSWAARPGESYDTRWNLERIQTATPSDQARLVSPVTAARLRRPRAIAGSSQSVRLAFDEQKQSQAIAGGRFRVAGFLFSQILDQTSIADDDKVRLFITTRGEVFRGQASYDEAQTIPARIYCAAKQQPQPDDYDPLLAEAEPFFVHLIPGTDYEPVEPDGDSAEAEFPTKRSLLVWLKQPLAAGTEFKSTAGNLFPTNIDDAVVVADIPPVPTDGATGGFWLRETAPPIARAERSFPSLDVRTELLPAPDARISASGAWTLAVAVFNKRTEGTQRFYTFESISAAIAVRFLNSAGKLRAPKTSVSILAERRVPSGAPPAEKPLTILAGYGRLSDESFDPVRPRPADAGGGVATIEWLRTAGLNVLHRASADTKYLYDVVASGPGGEVFPTELDSLPEG